MFKTTSTSKLLKLGYKNYKELWIDYINNFLTIQGFADYHQIEESIAIEILDNASYLYSEKIEKDKTMNNKLKISIINSIQVLEKELKIKPYPLNKLHKMDMEKLKRIKNNRLDKYNYMTRKGMI